jgi:alpha-mannosidase
MLKHPEITHRRVRSFVAELKDHLYGESSPLSVSVNEEPARDDKEALKGEWSTVTKGYQWGPAYNTRWFRVTGSIPKEFDGKTLRVIADVGGERTVWRDGSPVFGVDLEHTDFGVLSGKAVQLGDQPAKAGDKIDVLIQAYARNPQVRVHGREPKRDELVESVGRVELITFDPNLQALLFDVEFGLSLLDGLEKGDPNYAIYLRALNSAINLLQWDDHESIAAARKEIKKGTQDLSCKFKHAITAVGHAHLDTAWLWPIEITKKKMAHTTATQLALMERYDWFVFAHSQASQYEWLEKGYPTLFARVKDAVKRGQWEPVGSMWVEADCNIPGGESLVRQFLYGRKYFRDKLGYETQDMFLPDVFGYAAALPQILAGFGINYFLTQKISWNQTNKFPHNTFLWQGIDGTKVWSHFPPADTYIGNSEPAEILRSVKNHKDQGRSDESLYLFGFGDGGGGPTERHLELLERAKACKILPELRTGGTVADFFREAQKNSKDLATWSGELYLEFHRGTYTSQAAMKMLNRECEMLLRDAEMLASFYCQGNDYPTEKLEAAWKLVLLNQFHDIIPGSSVHEVYVDAQETYRQAYVAAYQVILDCIHRAGSSSDKEEPNQIALFKNSTAGGEVLVDEYHIDGKPPKSVVFGDESLPVQFVELQPIDDPEELGMLIFEAPKQSLGGVAFGQFSDKDTPTPYKRKGSATQLESEDWLIKLDKNGNLTSIQQKSTKQEFLQPGQLGNVFQLLDDRPLFWSAWDIDPYAYETAKDLTKADSVKVVENGPVRVAVEITRSFSKSKIVQRISLGPTPGIRFDTEVDWHEEDKMLKVAFPVAINSTRATYEIQYGHTERDTHYNTSWDMARFEVCAQKWVDLSEGGRGVALINNCKYGHDIHESVMRLSLLRSPKAPDPECDMGVHRFSYCLLPHQGSLQEAGVVAAAYAFNTPVHYAFVAGKGTAPLVQVDTANLVIESVKQAEDGKGTIVRLYECHNARGSANLKLSKTIKTAKRCNLEEKNEADLPIIDGGIMFDYRPFEILSFRITM